MLGHITKYIPKSGGIKELEGPLYGQGGSCSGCFYLGSVSISKHGLYSSDAGEYDLYVCMSGGLGGCTVLAQWSPDPPDNSSGLYFGKHGHIKSLEIAYKVGRELGLITDDNEGILS